MHIRRLTDAEATAPFDCYHYRIIYQTFFGMRDVLGPLRLVRHTAILPFQYRRLAPARRVLVEACPSSTLKRLGLPHNNYKQPEGGPLARKRLLTRRRILDGLLRHVRFDAGQRRTMMRNGGGDALDAVIAAAGAARAWSEADHRAIARHPRDPAPKAGCSSTRPRLTSSQRRPFVPTVAAPPLPSPTRWRIAGRSWSAPSAPCSTPPRPPDARCSPAPGG